MQPIEAEIDCIAILGKLSSLCFHSISVLMRTLEVFFLLLSYYYVGLKEAAEPLVVLPTT
ncbi:MAG: hypothetical protein IJZ67_07775 [Alistipes sp.]|nr:hypothetical protein [Alistipes sp.]